jgi:hypothetical protein
LVDIADQTIQSLAKRPKVGPTAVRALLTAAQDVITTTRSTPVGPTAAVHHLINRLDTPDRAILTARLWSAVLTAFPA